MAVVVKWCVCALMKSYWNKVTGAGRFLLILWPFGWGAVKVGFILPFVGPLVWIGCASMDTCMWLWASFKTSITTYRA